MKRLAVVLSLGLIILGGNLLLPSTAHAATTFTIPAGKTLAATNGEACQSLDNAVQTEAQTMTNGGKCTLTFTDHTSQVEWFDLQNQAPTHTTQSIGADGNQTNTVSVPWAASAAAVAGLNQYYADFADTAQTTAALGAVAASGGTSDGALAGIAAHNAATGQTNSGACALTNLFSLDCFVKGFIVPISYVIFVLCNWILGIIGVLFNWTIIRTVFGFATYFGNSSGLLIAWGILRDIGNIALLFGFIFMGVSTILDLPRSEYTAKTALPGLIIFAVLLNFSLFAAEGVIDVANGFSSILSTQAGQSCSATDNTASCSNDGISGAIFKMTGFNSILADPLAQTNYDGVTQVIVYLLLALFAIITAMVLLAGSIMLISRAVVLVLLIITSPIGFAGMAVPPLHKLAKDWWHRLIDQAFFAPVFLLMIFISIKLAQGLGGANGTTGNLAAAIAGNGQNAAGSLQAVLLFVVIIGFMIASLMAAKSMGAAGAGFATKTAGALTVGAVAGTAAFAGRRTIGAASQAAASRIASSRFATTNPNLARFAYGIANKGATSSFDARNSAAGKFVGAQAGKAAGISFGSVGAAASHGYHGIEEQAVKQRVDFAGKISQSAAESTQEKQLKAQKIDLTQKRTDAVAERNKEEKLVNTDVEREKGLSADREAAIAAQEKKVADLKASRPDQAALTLEEEKLVAAKAKLERSKKFLSPQSEIDADQAALSLQTQRVEAMRAANPNQAAVASEEAALATLKSNHQAADAAATAAIKDRKDKFESGEAAFKSQLDRFDEDIKRTDAELNGGVITDSAGKKTTVNGVTLDAKRRTYARSLNGDQDGEDDKSGHGSGLRLRVPFTGVNMSVERHASHEAAEKVFKNLGKTDTDRALDTLRESMNKSASAPAAAPAPAAAAPAAAPAGGGGAAHH